MLDTLHGDMIRSELLSWAPLNFLYTPAALFSQPLAIFKKKPAIKKIAHVSRNCYKS